jgi:hypothetical protein
MAGQRDRAYEIEQLRRTEPLFGVFVFVAYANPLSMAQNMKSA